VGGIIPIATGVAYGIKQRGAAEHVWCFIGDMAYMTGVFHESLQYARYNELPITFVVEDNELSTNTPTLRSWGVEPTDEAEGLPRVGHILQLQKVTQIHPYILYYRYERKYPHVGVGKFIYF
jgi:TPP-dependent indolepyruvate ferredoxin oxidoreductase alpha subunit